MLAKLVQGLWQKCVLFVMNTWHRCENIPFFLKGSSPPPQGQFWLTHPVRQWNYTLHPLWLMPKGLPRVIIAPSHNWARKSFISVFKATLHDLHELFRLAVSLRKPLCIAPLKQYMNAISCHYFISSCFCCNGFSLLQLFWFESCQPNILKLNPVCFIALWMLVNITAIVFRTFCAVLYCVSCTVPPLFSHLLAPENTDLIPGGKPEIHQKPQWRTEIYHELRRLLEEVLRNIKSSWSHLDILPVNSVSLLLLMNSQMLSCCILHYWSILFLYYILD